MFFRIPIPNTGSCNGARTAECCLLLIYYCMEDETEGYFWYDVEKWDTVAEVEMK